ncbi:MAG: DNA/RNA nuclease SfsA [Thermodesulfovibrio sp.]
MRLDYPLTFKKIFARFIKRKNRFVVTVYVDGKVAECYLPNSGRLWELLIPEKTELMLVRNQTFQRLPFTVLACKKKDHWVLLHTHLTNKIIKSLINENILPIYKNFKVVSEEVRIGKGRLDLLLEDEKEKIYLEVKTCTLFGENVAMFPDAVTERGRRHLMELKSLAQKGMRTSVLFVVMNPNIKFFLPAYHIDFEFSKTFMEIREKVDIRAVSLDWDSSFSYVKTVKELEIPFEFLQKVLKEKGVYLLVTYLDTPKSIVIGRLGNIHFRKGYYVYVGKAKRGLFRRIKRHKEKSKRMHWHIDYFLKEAKIINDFPILTDKDIECRLAYSLSNISDATVPEFGSSDCQCKSHLFYFQENPVYKISFIEIVNQYRLDILVFD